MYFGNDGLRKRRFDKCLKSHISEDPSTSNTEEGPTHFSSVQDGRFIIFINHSEHNSVGKDLYYCYSKSQDYFLAH